MKRILVPIDGSPRSLTAIEQVKSNFSPKAFEIVLLMVYENSAVINSTAQEAAIRKELMDQLDMIAKGLEQYQVVKKAQIGKAGVRIVECAAELGVSMIVMTKSTKTTHSNTIGATASYVIRNATCNVFMVQERIRLRGSEYRGLIYRTAESDVTLRGQLTQKQSECLLPSVSAPVLYTVTVKRGRVRFIHRAFNNATKDWDLPPAAGQTEIMDISEGEEVQIPVDARTGGKILDRVRIANRNMKTEAVFHYKITLEEGLDSTDNER